MSNESGMMQKAMGKNNTKYLRDMQTETPQLSHIQQQKW